MNDTQRLRVREIIPLTLSALRRYAKYDFFSRYQIHAFTEGLIRAMREESLEHLQSILCQCGTEILKDMIFAIFSEKFCGCRDKQYFSLLERFAHPVGAVKQKPDDKRKPNAGQAFLSCAPPSRWPESVYFQTFGIDLLFEDQSSTIIIHALVDDIPVEVLALHEPWLQKRKEEARPVLPERFIDSISLRDWLLYSTEDLVRRYESVGHLRNQPLDRMLDSFSQQTLVEKRNTIQTLLARSDDPVAYMLYDLIRVVPTKQESDNDDDDDIDNAAQRRVFESLPWSSKLQFHDSMQSMLLNTSVDYDKVALEQRVLCLQVDNSVKERAMNKLREIRPEDPGNKAKQFLEGLVRIPFGFIRQEPSLCAVQDIRTLYQELMGAQDSKTTLCEIRKWLLHATDFRSEATKQLQSLSKLKLVRLLDSSNNSSKDDLIANLLLAPPSGSCASPKALHRYQTYVELQKKINFVDASLTDMRHQLHAAIHGHDAAKTQLLKVLAQWMNGTADGYCFGFEGSPGIGKTSLAKDGIANCLRDLSGCPRPFAFIALGGSSNGSTLEGHNYTYVNSTWGKIADVLMESKCMNPIIYVDELDKVSKTDAGREIIGILTHLLDSTQNHAFQDRYFAGVPLDLSKALFIFSYNDPDQLDPILLDRIHRIKFDNLSREEKLVIVRKFLIPSLDRKFGLEPGAICLDVDAIQRLIQNYTTEPGVRKLKELLYDLWGEINLELLSSQDVELPVVVRAADLGKTFLKHQQCVALTTPPISSVSRAGVVLGMWASAVGQGGLLPVETMWSPGLDFLELKLTGSQGDVMKESMNVAKSLAWSSLTEEFQQSIQRSRASWGIHVHCPEGAVSKDGPSAGAAIALALYSLWKNQSVQPKLALTGEVNLQGDILAVGGLENKFVGAIQAGIEVILYPDSNQRDVKQIQERYGDWMEEQNVRLIPIKHIQDAFNIAFLT
jgi:hypothetical protein